MGPLSGQFERIREDFYFTVHGKSLGYQQVLAALAVDILYFKVTYD
jgi:hypothetical protein